MTVKINRIVFILFLPILTATAKNFELRNGDLIFQESVLNSNIGQAIKGVTTSVDDYHFTHVGMVYIDERDSVFVLEATHPRVALTPLKDYLYSREKGTSFPKSVVFRLKHEYQHCISKAIEEGLKLIGKEYDDAYTLNDDKYYCSELIYEMLLKANDEIPVFLLNTMTFKSPVSEDFLPEWIEHYKKLGVPIPEGMSGINPGAMSRSAVVEFVSDL